MSKRDAFLFANDSTRFYFPWICLLMVFIGTLLSGMGLFVYNSLDRWHQGVSQSLTIQINTYDENGVYRQDEIPVDVEKVLSIVRTTPGVKEASVLNELQMAELMAPWIGADVSISDLPLPKLIDVAIDPENPPFLEQLKMDLNVQVPNATMDSHRIWLSQLVKMSNRILQLIGAILILLIITVIFTVGYTTRANLKIQEPIIRLVHMMGAKDLYITNRYAWRTLKRAFTGGFIGFACASPILFGLMCCFGGMSDTIFVTNLLWEQWVFLAVCPIVIALVAFITTFKTVMGYLKRFV
ncbi:MAG: hypothetical protein E7021_03090 [Alphaproteobacteria bacterium]|nr:hypothetical protein [Alphaproteobacteria bacterium]